MADVLRYAPSRLLEAVRGEGELGNFIRERSEGIRRFIEPKWYITLPLGFAVALGACCGLAYVT